MHKCVSGTMLIPRYGGKGKIQINVLTMNKISGKTYLGIINLAVSLYNMVKP